MPNLPVDLSAYYLVGWMFIGLGILMALVAIWCRLEKREEKRIKALIDYAVEKFFDHHFIFQFNVDGTEDFWEKLENILIKKNSLPLFPKGPLNNLYPSPENIKDSLEKHQQSEYIPLHLRAGSAVNKKKSK